MKDDKTEPEDKKKGNVKFSKFVTSLRFMKKSANEDKDENIKKNVKYSNNDHVWILQEFEEQVNAFFKNKNSSKNKNYVSLTYMGRRSYKNHSPHINLYNIEIKKFINSIKRNKPVKSLRE
ncbi:conserved protein, unknown function [Hepatocystis sp. ex Piliocolobus tephrosceles]|nr:conserved protein, unknown function [Hepatocystis sp. ex Piliocolobus tephrosceles]